MNWVGKLRAWVSGGARSTSAEDAAMSLESRLGTAEAELIQITRDVYAVLLDARSGTAHHH